MRVLTAVALMLLLPCSSIAAPLNLAQRARVAASGKIGAEVVDALETQASVRVLVVLAVPELQQRTLRGNRVARRQAVQRTREQLLGRLRDGEFAVTHRYAVVNALAGVVSSGGVQRLADDPAVARVDLDTGGRAQLNQAVPLSHLDIVHDLGFTGRGVVAAVVDSGANNAHQDLTDSIIAQHCFCEACANSQCDRLRPCCPDGTAEQDGPGSAQDDNGHGTNVTGILTSNGSVAPRGGAPDVQIVSVKVLDNTAAFATSAQVISGLDWILDNRPDVRIVNMSLGTNARFTARCSDASGACLNTTCTSTSECLAIGENGRCNPTTNRCEFQCTTSADCPCGNQPSCTGNCDVTDPDNARVMAFTAAIDALYESGIAVFASSGNQESGTSMPLPGCVGNSISVGAVWDSNVGSQTFPGACTDSTTQADQVTCFSNSDVSTDVFAPGGPMTSTGLRDPTSTFRGTSQSSPIAAACAAVLLQVHPDLTPDEIEAALKVSPTHVTDATNGLSFPRVDCEAALLSLGPLPPTASPTPSNTITPTPTFTPTGSRPPTETPTETATITATVPATATASQSPTISSVACAGDCNSSRNVSIDELVLGVNIALDRAAVSNCINVDRDNSGTVTVDELVAAVNNALRNCF